MNAKLPLGALALLALLAPSARADYVTRSYVLDQSGQLPDGLGYGNVTIEAYDGVGDPANDLAAGQVRLTFEAEVIPLYGPVKDRFGFRAAGFNTDLALVESQIALPAGWKLRTDRNMGGFGKFAWQAHGKPRQNPLVITIDGLGAAATLEHFLIPSMTAGGDYPVQGPVYFAARIGGFDLNDDVHDATSHVAGAGYPMPPPGTDPEWPDPDGSNGSPTEPPVPNPEPSTLLLCALGAGCVGITRRLIRR
jgi:hypothetical protein